MFSLFWIKKVLFFSNNIFKSSSLFSLLSLVLACTFLSVAILVVNGFSASLEKSLIDLNGHIMVSAPSPVSKKQFLKPLSQYKKDIQHQSPFLSFEGLLLKSKQFKGVIFEARSFKKLPLFFKNRILKGRISNHKEGVVIGKALAQELRLKIGSPVYAIVPLQGSILKKKSKQISVVAIIDFGSYDLNSRYVLVPLSAGQYLYQQASKVSGIRLWLYQKDKVNSFMLKIKNQMPNSFEIFSWKQLETAFFKMIESDKKIIFFVLFLLIIVAGFNTSSSLFVNVFKKTKEISILKTMGASRFLLFSIFSLKGLIIGIIGSTLGILLGSSIFFSLIEIQKKWNFIPETIYKVNPIYAEWNYKDFLLLFLATLLVTFIASLLPARRACLIDIKQGLDYE